MYTPGYSKVTDEAVLLELMRRYSFALLVTAGAKGLVGTHLPVVAKSVGLIEFHIARGNGQWRELEGGVEGMLVFSGAHAYMSPAWYADRATVPTWNYGAVHVYGRGRMLDSTGLRRHLEELVAVNEAARGTGWALKETPEEYVAGLEKGIVGFGFEVSRLEGKLKMSQNRDWADRAGAIEGLKATGRADDAEVAEWMEREQRRGG